MSITHVRRIATLAILCLTAGLVAAPPAPAVSKAKRAKCVSKGYRTVYKFSRGGIFQTARGARNPNRRGGYYACLYRYGVRQTIGSFAPEHFSFAGRYFAYTRPVVHEEGGSFLPATVAVIDLRARRASRKWVHGASSAGPGPQPEPPADQLNHDPVVDLVATTNGAAAWIAEPRDPGGSDYQVLAVDGRSLRAPARLLDIGPALDLDSLRRVRKVNVRWSNAGVTMTEHLRSR